MTLVMTSLPLARVFQCLFTFALVSAWRWLAEIWQLSRRGTTGELEVEFKFQRRGCKLSFLFPPRRQSAPQSSLVDQQSIQTLLETCKTDLGGILYEKKRRTIPVKTLHSLKVDNPQSNLKISFMEFFSPKFEIYFFVISTGTSTEARHSLVNWTHVEYLLWLGGAFGFLSFHSHLWSKVLPIWFVKYWKASVIFPLVECNECGKVAFLVGGIFLHAW